MENVNKLDYVVRLESGDLVAAVYGLGYVGLSLCAVWLRAGARVIGIDVNNEKINELNSGVVNHVEETIKRTVKDALAKGLFKATTDGVEASRSSTVKFVTVPVPLREDGSSNLSAIIDVSKSIGEGLKKGDIVILESSVPPGTTSDIMKPILEDVSRLKVEEDFLLAYSPERILVGRAVNDIEERYPKIIGGVGPKSVEAAKFLYESVATRGVIVMSSSKAAEFEKLVEGVYRDVNIALANELAKLTAELGLDYLEVAKVANTQPYCHLHQPGVGVGGACIPVYPMFLSYMAKEKEVDFPLVRLARKVNLEMPNYTVRLASMVLAKLKIEEPRIAILGLAFRGDVDDTRLSPTYDLLRELLKLGFNNFVVHDPYIKYDAMLEELDITLTNEIKEALINADLVIVATDHSIYKTLPLMKLKDLTGKPQIGVVDGRNIVIEWVEPPEGVVYVGIGRALRFKGDLKGQF